MTGPVALVTGASSGIGAAFARRLAADGYDLLLVARRVARLEEVARQAQERFGVRAEVLPADLTGAADLRRVEGRIASAGNLALLVNNAGFGTLGRFFEADVAAQERMHSLHVTATLRLTHAALAGMVARGRGAVVNVSSVAAFASSPGNASYCATKAWMNRFTEGLFLDLASAGSPVTVQALCPGYTFSEFHDVLGVDRKTIPRFLWMSAEDVVDASMRGLARGKLYVVPGWRYRLLLLGMAVTPRRLRLAAALRARRRFGREERPAGG